MKVSYKWLQEYIEESLPKVQELVETLTMHSFEVEGVESKDDDSILDIKILPNRSHDCLSHYGIASEIASILGLNRKLLLPSQPFAGSKEIDLSIDTDKCSRAVMVLIKDVKIKDSPKWLKDKLKLLGQRPINSVVDVTNYLMYSYGQPMHAFDADKINCTLSQYKIKIREASDGEKITLLNGTEYSLKEGMIVIADTDKALDVAGIMGGKDSSVTSETKNIILSLSNFNAIKIRKTAKDLNIRTDASSRFENEISPCLVDRAMPYALNMILELSKGEFVSGVDLYKDKQVPVSISTTSEEISKILGVEINPTTVINLLGRQKIDVKKEEDKFIVTPPLERLDLKIKEDIAEEVGRLYGFSKIKGEPLSGTFKTAVNNEIYTINVLRNILLDNGYSEIYTYTFGKMGDTELENPLASDKKFLRRNLSTGMEIALENNFKYLDLLGIPRVKLFEIGKVFTGAGEKLKFSIGIKNPKSKKYVSADEEVAMTIRTIEEKLNIKIDKVSVVGGVVEVDLDTIIEKISLPESYSHDTWNYSIKHQGFKPISPYPFAVRDVAVFVPNTFESNKLEELIKEKLTDIVVRFSLFDKFQKEEKTSYAFRLVFQANDRTLTDEEINAVMNPIYNTLKSQEGFDIR